MAWEKCIYQQSQRGAYWRIGVPIIHSLDGSKNHPFVTPGHLERWGLGSTQRWHLVPSLPHVQVPRLELFDRFGVRINGVSFHPAYHELMELGSLGEAVRVPSEAEVGPKRKGREHSYLCR